MTAWVGSEVGQTWHTLTSSPRLPGVQKRLARRLDPAFVAPPGPPRDKPGFEPTGLMPYPEKTRTHSTGTAAPASESRRGGERIPPADIFFIRAGCVSSPSPLVHPRVGSSVQAWLQRQPFGVPVSRKAQL